MPTGQVRFYADAKGFGLIRTAPRHHVFLHAAVPPPATPPL